MRIPKLSFAKVRLDSNYIPSDGVGEGPAVTAVDLFGLCTIISNTQMDLCRPDIRSCGASSSPQE